MFAAVDILHRENGAWSLYEVKSSMGIKESYILDIALQSWVVEGSGLPLKSSNLINLNKYYERESELDISALFNITDVSLRIRPWQIPVPENREKMMELLEKGGTGA